MKDMSVINTLLKTYKKYTSFIIEDKALSSETEKKKSLTTLDREKEKKFLLLLEKNLKKYSFDF